MNFLKSLKRNKGTYVDFSEYLSMLCTLFNYNSVTVERVNIDKERKFREETIWSSCSTFFSFATDIQYIYNKKRTRKENL